MRMVHLQLKGIPPLIFTKSSWTDRSRTFFTQLFDEEALPSIRGWSLWRVWILLTVVWVYSHNKRQVYRFSPTINPLHNGYLSTLRLYYKPGFIMKLCLYNPAKPAQETLLNLNQQFPQSANGQENFTECLPTNRVVIFLVFNIKMLFHRKKMDCCCGAYNLLNTISSNSCLWKTILLLLGRSDLKRKL